MDRSRNCPGRWKQVEEMLVFLAESRGLLLWATGLIAVLAIAWSAAGKGHFAPYRGRILICLALLYLSFVFFFLSFGLEEIEAVGSSARTAPRLWSAGLALFTFDQLRRTLQGRAPKDPESGDIRRVLVAAIVVAFSLWGMDVVGYYISSGVMLLVLCVLLGEKRLFVILSLAGGWVLFSWVVFYRMLNLDLPLGLFF
ncbi:tripartite tricarboxylate transporter TctB family protein [Aminivibrio sp.]|jgi:hypothetical protein|uniref:tripartite tricarboxylate transporter TctB family protein n=1 Tax=Aminivibrio sp. TaxID=1872489 RepID=UPI001A61B770|nr:tripartite tricarboxylate transporter TctB family protein [Aminivibrio sp.]MBL3540193.1 tripartite tricarboxylate transporter TctB family protein [Aminivibrio sp.]MDK2958704.1 putative tricarboxylic transport rane protein [Synergistaceae bacterium]